MHCPRCGEAMTSGRLRSQKEAHLVRAFGPFGLPLFHRPADGSEDRRLFVGRQDGHEADACPACGTLVIAGPAPDEPEEWECPACRVMVPGRFETCWKCHSRRRA